jgi:FkbM family methyltransferase
MIQCLIVNYNFLINNISLKTFTKGIIEYIKELIYFFKSKKTNKRFLLTSMNFFKNQIIYDRILRKKIPVAIRNNIDLLVLKQIYLGEPYSLRHSKRYPDLLNEYNKIISSGKDPLIVDCGGNIGLATKYFHEDYPQAKILLLEPEPKNIIQAKLNNHSSKLSNKIEFIEKAVGSEKSKVEIFDPGTGDWGFQVNHSKSGTIDVTTVNELLAIYDESSFTPFLIKIDIEGFENDLFSKNTEWINKFPVLIIELHDWLFPKEANSSNFLKAIAPLNRDFIYRGETIFSIKN